MIKGHCSYCSGATRDGYCPACGIGNATIYGRPRRDPIAELLRQSTWTFRMVRALVIVALGALAMLAWWWTR